MPRPSIGRIQGVVLAGGLSRRMGRDKADVVLGGRSLLARTCARLAPQCASLAVSRHDAAAVSGALDYAVIPDALAGHAGPLAGVLAALDWTALRDSAVTHVATVAVDTPFLPEDFVSRLAAAIRACDTRIACAASGGRLHPVSALWPIASRHDLRRSLVAEGIRRVVTVLERFGFATADWPVAPYDPFLNLNTPEDLTQAEAVAMRFDSARQ